MSKSITTQHQCDAAIQAHRMSESDVADLLVSLRRHGMLTRDETTDVTMLLERASAINRTIENDDLERIYDAFISAAAFIIQCAFNRECKAIPA